MAKKDLYDYSELIIVTILSLIAANFWIRGIGVYMDKYWKDNLYMYMFLGALVTGIAIFCSYIFFADDTSDEDKN